jgi:hypothetical protein
VLIAPITADERLTTTHRAKLAYVYVRQSSLNQVRQHQESTELQYRLVNRAVGLGWPHERAQVIDEDLGKSGAGSVERHGFQKLIAEIGLGNAGDALIRHRNPHANCFCQQLDDLCENVRRCAWALNTRPAPCYRTFSNRIRYFSQEARSFSVHSQAEAA